MHIQSETAHVLTRVLFEGLQRIEIGLLGRGSPAERKRSAVIINGPSQQQQEEKKSFQGETENNVLQLQSTAAAAPARVLYTGAAIIAMNSTH